MKGALPAWPDPYGQRSWSHRVARYDFAPAVCLYGGNMILLALTAIRISFVVETDTKRRIVPGGRVDLAVLISSALLSMVISLFATESAMLAYFLNLATPLVHRWTRRESRLVRD